MEMIYTILIIVVILIALYFILGWAFKKSVHLSGMRSALNNPLSVDSSKLPKSKNTSNYAYSTWFYVQDWNVNWGSEKILLSRASRGKTGHLDSCPKISLGATENDINITVNLFPPSDGTVDNPHIAVVRNFPLQKWVNLIISLYGRTLDIYIDGKLVKSDVLPRPTQPCSGSKELLQITPGGGFSGWTSNFQYYSHALNPQEAYNIYKEGYGGSILGNMFNKYRIKVSLMEDNKEETSFEI